MFYIENLFFTLFLLKFHIWENSCSWNKGQNTRSQLYCRIFNWTISPKQIAGIASFGHVAIINAWSKLFWQSMVRNECGQSGYGALKGTSIWNKLLFLRTGTNSDKLKIDSMIFEWAWSKMVKLFSSWDPKICCTLRMNLRIELIFWMLLYL